MHGAGGNTGTNPYGKWLILLCEFMLAVERVSKACQS